MSSPKRKPRLRPLVEIGLGVAWLIGIAAALQIVELLLGRSMIGVAIIGAVLVDLGASWAGLTWDTGPRRSWQEAAARVGWGAAIAVLLLALTVGASAALGWAQVGLGEPGAAIGFAALRYAAIGVRDELLFRGIPLMAAARARVPDGIARGFAALTSAAALALRPDARPLAIVLAACTGFLFATLWRRDRGAWAAVGAHAALAFGAATLLRGGLLDVIFTRGDLVLGPRADGAPAFLLAAAAVGIALVLPRLPGNDGGSARQAGLCPHTPGFRSRTPEETADR